MASIILDSSDDDIPDTPENVNIRGVIPKVNYLDGKGSQYTVRFNCLNLTSNLNFYGFYFNLVNFKMLFSLPEMF
jgi:hypothetical protein